MSQNISGSEVVVDYVAGDGELARELASEV